MNKECENCKFKEECSIEADKVEVNYGRCVPRDMLEIKKINIFIDLFSRKLSSRLIQKVGEGYVGWDVESCEGDLIKELQEDAARLSAFQRKEIDIAARAMFIYFIRDSVEAKIKEIADKE